MALTIEPMTAEHLDGAAALLAARQRALCAADPALPAAYGNPSAARPLIEAALDADGAYGVAALQDGALLGYAIGRPLLDRPLLRPRPAGIEYGDHAVAIEDGAEVYRALYAALAPHWLERGQYSHYVFVPAEDRQALSAWRSTGFGREDVRGVRDLAPLEPSPVAAEVELREAGTEDLAEVARLLRGLIRHHTQPPVFEAFSPEIEPSFCDHLAERLADSEAYVLLAARGRETLGFISMAPNGPRAPLLTPEGSVQLESAFVEPGERGSGAARRLVDAAFAWARGRGHTWCTIGWRSANLPAARFWTEAGFRPIAYRLTRHVDPRIAWARV